MKDLRHPHVNLARVGDAEGLGAEDAFAEERDEGVVDGVAELERQLRRDDVGDDHDAVQQQLPVVARGVATTHHVDVGGGADGEEEQEEDEEEGLAVVGGDTGGGEEHRADHVALRGVEAGADDVGETAMVHRSRDAGERSGERGRRLVEDQLGAAVDHVALVGVGLRGDVQQRVLGLLRADLREAQLRLGNRLAGQHGLVDDAAALQQQTVAGSRHRGSDDEGRKRLLGGRGELLARLAAAETDDVAGNEVAALHVLPGALRVRGERDTCVTIDEDGRGLRAHGAETLHVLDTLLHLHRLHQHQHRQREQREKQVIVKTP